MKKLLSLAVLSAVALAGYNSLRTRDLCTGFLPENDMKIHVGDVNALGIDEATFNQVLDKAEKFYAPVIAAKGATLQVNRKWTDATVNASAQQSGKTWIINMYGGLARHKAVTADGFALVACHELGHHLGGFPKIAGWGNKWATNEGGSDYFSTLKCLRNVLSKDAAANVDPTAKAGCANAYAEGADRNLCEAGVMAGVSVSSLLAELGGKPQPSLTTPDTTAVTRTNDRHPAAQCRLDTYYQAALCPKPVSEDVSDTSETPGSCTAAGGYKEGLRPLCWYKPPTTINESAVARNLQALEGAFSGRGL